MSRRKQAQLGVLLAVLTAGVHAHAQPEPAEQPPADEPAEGEGEEFAPEGEEEFEEEELEDEEDEELLDPARPAPAGMGVVWGVLKDTKLGEPLIEAEVTVIGTKYKTITDFDGNFRLELPPGSYNIRFWYELHQAAVRKAVIVTQGGIVQLDETLEPEEGAVETFEIETEADTSSIEGQLLSRKRASVVGDSVGRAEIAKTPDKNAAEAAKRVVGATVVGGRFVYVRGLGERYTNALLDGAPLPSPEPDRQTVPLDLFPSKVLDSLTIVKSFTPEMPGDFAGGSVRIGTRRLPKEFLFSVGASIGLNSQATFSDTLTYQGSNTDFLGIDSGTRALPDSIPDNYKIQRGLRKPNGELISLEELERAGQDINAFMSTKKQTAPPNHSFSVVIGNTFDVGGDDKLGVIGAITYGRSFEARDDEIYRTASASNENPDQLTELNRLTIQRGIDKVRWGGMLGLTYELNPRHKLHVTAMHSRSADDEAREVEGFHEERGARVHETRLEFVSRSLTFGQLRGEHEFEALDAARFDWNASVALATRDQPDTRAVVYEFGESFGYAFEDDSFSGLHFYSEMQERTVGGGLNWMQPLSDSEDEPVAFKLGGLVNLRARQFDARRFRFTPSSGGANLVCDIQEWDPGCSDSIFTAQNIGTELELFEGTNPTDAYETDLNVFAGYVMLDAHLSKSLRIVGGPRLEASSLTLEAFDRFNPSERLTAGLDDDAIMPGLAVIWGVRDDMNLRFAASRTIARPQLLEFAPFQFTNYFGGYTEQGNPNLVNTRIWNGDIRWEWFPTLREVVAASIFAKRFEDPIEQVLRAGSGNSLITYQNAFGANLIGGEVEARKSFDFITPALKDLSIIANITLAFSQVDIDTESFTGQGVTSAERPLTNQAPWVLNLSLDYGNEDIGTRARVLYNIAGKRIVTAGESPLPDIYEQPRHTLDATVAQRIVDGFDIKLTGKNLLNGEYLRTYGSEDKGDETLHRSYTKGISVSLGASYTY